MVLGTLLLIVILAVVGIYFYAEISTIYNDYSSILIQKIIDEDFKVPTPNFGERVCDLIITIDIRSISAISSDIISHNRILYTDGREGKQIGWQWQNCHDFTSSLFSVTLLDVITDSDYSTLEFFIPDSSPFDQKIILSYSLVDQNGLKKKLPLYQKVTYIHPALQTHYDFSQQLKFRDLIPQDWTLEILSNEAHFEDKIIGDPLRKTITYTG